MKLIALITSLVFTANVFAASIPSRELGQALDSYQYAISVEWDQQDRAFLDARTAEFQQTAERLFREGSMSTQDMMAFLNGRIKDQRVLESIRAQVALNQVQSPAELASMLRNHSSDLYVRGASWSSANSVLLAGGLIALFAGLILLASAATDKGECLEYAEYEEYDTYTDEYLGMVSLCKTYSLD